MVLPALRRSVERGRAVRQGRGCPLAPGRPVHRRRRARHPPPDVRAVLHQGAVRPRDRAEGPPRAVRPPVHARHDPHGRVEDVEEQGQPGRARAIPRHGWRRRAPAVPSLRRPAAGRRRLGRRRHRRVRPLPRPAVAAGRPRQPGRGRGGGSGCSRPGRPPADRPGHRRVRPLVLQHRRGGVHGVHEPALQGGADPVRGRHAAPVVGPVRAPHHRRAVGAAPPRRARPREALARRRRRPGQAGHRRDGRAGQRQDARHARRAPDIDRSRRRAHGAGVGEGPRALAGATPKKVIARPPRLVNVVI